MRGSSALTVFVATEALSVEELVEETVVSKTIALCLTDGFFVSFEIKSEGLARVFMASSSSESVFKERLGKTESFD